MLLTFIKYRLMLVKVLQIIKLPLVIKIFVLSIFKRPLKTGFSVSKLPTSYFHLCHRFFQQIWHGKIEWKLNS